MLGRRWRTANGRTSLVLGPVLELGLGLVPALGLVPVLVLVLVLGLVHRLP
jgi:hypothetical protein